MLARACFATVLGWLSVAYAQDRFCSGDLCFFRPDHNSGNTWSASQSICKENNSTLPIADNPDHQKSFVGALSHFQLNGMDVWLGANASDDGADNWRWLDGRQYNGADVQQMGEYYKSYAYVSKKTAEVLAYATAPNSSYSYICQYNVNTPDVCLNGTGRTAFVRDNQCYVMYDEKLSWFSARNKCLENKGDLASFSQLSLLDGIIDSSGFWVGLRHSHWDWRTANGDRYDVTFTSWRIGQPNDALPRCMAIDQGDYPNWKDVSCTLSYSYICQEILLTNILPLELTTSTARPSTSTSDSRLLRPSSITTTSWPTSNLSSSDPQSNNTKPVQAVNSDSSVAIGVGIGVPCAIVILALAITVILLQREIRKLKDRLKYKSGEKVPESNVQKLNSHTAMQQTTGNTGEDNMQYEELQNQSRLQDQREYEQLSSGQSQYERV